MQNKFVLKGVYTALVTPFKEGQFDQKSYRKLLEHQISGGVNGLVPCGTTGETPNLSPDEQKLIIEITKDMASNKIPVIAGVGSNSTAKSIVSAKEAAMAGADILMVSVPYYNKPSQEGLYQHFKAISEAVDLPMIIYNNPARAVTNMQDETIARVAEFSNIIGVKDASGDLERPMVLRRLISKSFYLLSGEDSTAVAFNASGGDGCISVAANIVPKQIAGLQKLWFSGKIQEAISEQISLLPLYKALFCETNPTPIKYALSLLGICEPELRLPLVEPSDANKKLIQTVLKEFSII